MIAAIPARYAAARLPGKLLAELGGMPLIAHPVRRALQARLIDTVLVATDHEGIGAAARAAGAEVVMTDPALASGSDRIGVALAGRSFRLALNIQGDEPEIDPADLDALIVAMDATPSADIGTLAAPLAGDELSDPHCVKVVTDGAGRALYFSRARIGADRQDLIDSAPRPRSAARRHVGVYAYRPAALATFLAAPPSPLEQAERLEQLRALELGLTILVIDLDAAPRGIDTAADLEAARRRFGAK